MALTVLCHLLQWVSRQPLNAGSASNATIVFSVLVSSSYCPAKDPFLAIIHDKFTHLIPLKLLFQKPLIYDIVNGCARMYALTSSW